MMLRMVGINDPERRVHAYPHELSTGMTQRVLIAMALSSHPRLLIADEPTSGLDVTIQAQFLDQMWEATQATGSAVLLVTQNLGIVANYCDRVVVMADGAIVESAPVREFFEAPQNDVLQERSFHCNAPRRATTRGADGALGRCACRQAIGRGARSVEGFRYPRIQGEGACRGPGVVRRSAPRECLGLVGESGSGKTTVGRCLLRLEAPTAGEIFFGEKPLHC